MNQHIAMLTITPNLNLIIKLTEICQSCSSYFMNGFLDLTNGILTQITHWKIGTVNRAY